MKKLTLVLDEYDVANDYQDNDFKDYLLSIDGIEEVNINFNDEEHVINIDITYDEEVINYQVIYMEIESYLNVFNLPVLIKFDKHPTNKTNVYKLESSMCCEYCFKIAMEDLFEIDGIEKIDNNYLEQYYGKFSERGKDTFIIYYDSKVLTEERLKEIIKEKDI